MPKIIYDKYIMQRYASSSHFCDFINKYRFHGFSFPEIKIVVGSDGKKKKDPIFKLKWTELEFDDENREKYVKKKHDCFCVVTGKPSNCIVIDCDSDNVYDDLIKDYPELQNTLTVKTKKGKHIYVKYNENPKIISNTKSFKTRGDIDIRTDKGLIFAPFTSYLKDCELIKYEIINDAELVDFPEKLIDELKEIEEVEDVPREKKECREKPIVIHENTLDVNKEMVLECADIISLQYLDNYSDWLSIVFSFASMGEDTKEECKRISRKSDKYTNDGFEKAWNSYYSRGITYKTILGFASKSNRKKFLEILNKHEQIFFLECDDTSIASTISMYFGDRFIYDGKNMNYFNGTVWTKDNEAVHFDKICEKMAKIYNDLRLQNISNKDYCKKVDAILRKLLNTFPAKGIFAKLKSKQINTDIIWENKPLFCFSNKVYDLVEGDWKKPNPDDLMNMSTGYAWKEPTKKEIETVNKIINEIFVDREKRDFYMQVLCSGLFPTTMEKFILANGSGRNGKGVIHDLFKATLGNDYFYAFNTEILTKGCKEGANSDIAGFHHKRFCVGREPASGKINASTCKLLTGGGSVNARHLYEKSGIVDLKLTMVLECNPPRPTFTGQGGDSMEQRLIDVLFESKFIQEEITDDMINTFPVNPIYKDATFQNNHRCALFKILVEDYLPLFLKNDRLLKPPHSIVERGIELIKAGDEVYQWFIDNYEMGEKEDYIQIKDIYEELKYSSFFKMMTRKEQRAYNLSHFREVIKDSTSLRRYFKERIRMDGIDYRNIILGWKKIEV